MKFTLGWLKDHLETNASLDDILYSLTDLGLEVEEVSNPVDRLKDFTIGKVIEAEKHPSADKLQICQVETAEGKSQIICGAPNARAGITVVIATPGTYVPGIDTTIGVGKIRGIESFGMMCSEHEMELSDEHDGIIELANGEVGDRFTDWLAANDPSKVDIVIEIAITPNRPDALGVRGIARDLAARGLGSLKAEKIIDIKSVFPCPVSVSIDADARKQCPVFYGRVIKGVKNGPSPQWLQDRLNAIGLRSISALVDVTNFFTYDNNRPLHVFDADKVAGNKLRIHRAEGGETFSALDDKEYILSEGMTVISDSSGIESLGGIMGGIRSGCTVDTTDVFIEAAFFDPIRTAYTGRMLKINSDARYRFERGIDPNWTPKGIDAATQMILEICGGKASEIVVAGELPDHSRSYYFDTDRVQSLVGMTISADMQRETLTALGFKLEGETVHVPSWRPDVAGEADLIEEVARIASLTKLEGLPLPRKSAGVQKPILSPRQKREQIGRRAMAALGYNECVTYSFIDKKSAMLFGGGTDKTMLANPISSEMSHMRPDLLAGLLQAASRNQARDVHDLALFEVGPAFHGGEPEEQHLQIAGLLIGHTVAKDVHGESRPIDLYDAKADAEAVLAAIGSPAKVQVLREGAPWWHPGRHGRLCLGPKKVLATFGELHPKVLNEMGVKGCAFAFTIWPQDVPLPRKSTTTRPALRLNDLQAVERDFAFVVNRSVEALAVVNAAASADKALIENVSLFDEFIGESLGDEKKSLAIKVRLQPQEATLKDEAIKAVSQRIVDKVFKVTGGELRD
ncbi:MAG: phenylalanine--tRNA ligase subunit beta [Aestuariivita sp.]|nr:phenylalanine--tRNA ligase subunit beta [Aestuariivita sp.]